MRPAKLVMDSPAAPASTQSGAVRAGPRAAAMIDRMIRVEDIASDARFRRLADLPAVAH